MWAGASPQPGWCPRPCSRSTSRQHRPSIYVAHIHICLVCSADKTVLHCLARTGSNHLFLPVVGRPGVVADSDCRHQPQCSAPPGLTHVPGHTAKLHLHGRNLEACISKHCDRVAVSSFLRLLEHEPLPVACMQTTGCSPAPAVSLPQTLPSFQRPVGRA